MSAALEIVSPGAWASIQDAGRRGLRRIGVPWAGALDPARMRIANRLAGNAEEAPVIECFDGGQVLRALGAPVRLAVAGEVRLALVRGDEKTPVPSWRSVLLQPDEALRIERIGDGRVAVVAVEALAVRPHLGSASTYARARLGGLAGAPLAAGDRLPLAAAARSRAESELPPDTPADADRDERIRVLPGPQEEHFDPTALEAFYQARWRITAQADRMGMRLEGPVLAHRTGFGADIVSDATVPGAIQVPGNGHPIVLLADGQTAGGYPKIAVVIGADLARLATRAPGTLVRFARVSAEEAEDAACAAASRLETLLAAIRPVREPGAVDTAALYRNNLVSGVVDALSAAPLPPEKT